MRRQGLGLWNSHLIGVTLWQALAHCLGQPCAVFTKLLRTDIRALVPE